MSSPQRTGICQYCGEAASLKQMPKHLAACPKRQKRLDVSEQQPQPQRRPIIQLRVEGYDLPEYWMLLELPADTTLGTLDEYLRRVWLECCGHMSVFIIGEDKYGVEADAELGFKSMQRAKLGDLLEVGDWFGHEYDFGSTTALHLGVIGEREGVLAKNHIELMARNQAPDMRCGCGEPATQLCTQCIFETDDAWLCEDCAQDHECGEEMLLPVVNSPRVGVCGYTGQGA